MSERKNVKTLSPEKPATSRVEGSRQRIVKILRQMFQERGLSLDKIVLFGSMARGTERQDSDIDIIIVSKDFRKKSIFERVELIAGIGRELVRKTKKPFDMMFYSDQEWEKGNSLVINAAKKQGQILSCGEPTESNA
jgi:predicted nucleotidyltransferase